MLKSGFHIVHVKARATDGDGRESHLCDWEGGLLQGGDHLHFLWSDFIQLSHLILPPLCPGVVGEVGSGGEEGHDDANPEGTVTHAQIPVEDVPNPVNGGAGTKLC